MVGDDNHDSLGKVPKLEVSADYIQWRRRMKAYLQRNEPLLVGLQPRPSGRAASSSTTMEDWMIKSARSKGSVILCLGDTVASQTRLFVDDDTKTASDLWKEFERIFTMSNSQVIQKLKQKLDSLIFKDDGNFDKQIAYFLTIIGELATYDAELSESEKVSKLIRSLPSSFAPLAMVSSLQEFDFDKLVNAVQAELARRSNPHHQPPEKEQEKPKANWAKHQSSRGGNSRRHNRDKVRKGNGKHRGSFSNGIGKRTCDYCKMPGHLYRNCWTRVRDEESNSRSPSNKPRENGRPGRRASFGSDRGGNNRAQRDANPGNDKNRHRASWGVPGSPIGFSGRRYPREDRPSSRFADAGDDENV